MKARDCFCGGGVNVLFIKNFVDVLSHWIGPGTFAQKPNLMGRAPSVVARDISSLTSTCRDVAWRVKCESVFSHSSGAGRSPPSDIRRLFSMGGAESSSPLETELRSGFWTRSGWSRIWFWVGHGNGQRRLQGVAGLNQEPVQGSAESKAEI